MKCKLILVFLLSVVSAIVEAKSSMSYDSLAQDCLTLSKSFDSLTRLQYDAHCKSTLTRSDFMLIATAAHLQAHEKQPALSAIISVLNDFQTGDLSLCTHYRQILSSYRKAMNITNEIKRLPEAQTDSQHR